MRSILLGTTALLLSVGALLAQHTECEAIASFGEVELCLPGIPGYEETYALPAVKALADATEVPTNEVLGFYLNDATHARVDSFGTFAFDDYAKVYGTTQVANVSAGAEDLEVIRAGFIEMFGGEDWTAIRDEIDKLEMGIEMGKPKLLKEYRLTDDSFTVVLLIRQALPDGSHFDMLSAISGLLLRERYVNFAYYLNFEGDESVEALQAGSNEMIKAILAANQ